MNHANIRGYGVDADPANRPGIPMELPPERGFHARPPPPQQTPPAVPRPGRTDRVMPPVYGTAQPPRGLSGALRHYAYRYPSHLKRHWMLLLFADRVDVLEHRLGTIGTVAALASLVVGGRMARGLFRPARVSRPAGMFGRAGMPRPAGMFGRAGMPRPAGMFGRAGMPRSAGGFRPPGGFWH
jgi:hypothetical protein